MAGILDENVSSGFGQADGDIAANVFAGAVDNGSLVGERKIFVIILRLVSPLFLLRPLALVMKPVTVHPARSIEPDSFLGK